MRFVVLGSISLEADPPVELGGGRQRRVLAALLLRAGRPVEIDELAEWVWADSADLPKNPDRSLRVYVSRLRSLLAETGDDTEIIVTTPHGYQLELGSHQLDAELFEDKVGAARRLLDEDQPRRATALLGEAFDLWRGRPYGLIGDEWWAQVESDRLEELHLVAEELRLDVLMGEKAFGEVVAAAAGLAREHPLRESFRRRLILALHRSGRTAEALREYHDYRGWLATEVGIEPSGELQALESQMLADEPDLDRAPEQRVRGYELLERIGEGAFAVVYRGLQPSVGREVAIKQIRADFANRSEFIRQFEAEAQMVAHIEHPHVVPLYDFWREPSSAFLVMRWFRGGTLEQKLFERPLELEELRRMVAQVGSALSASHRSGVIHRDVKPANILLDDEGNFFLGDFGIALEGERRFDPEAALSAGSPAYAAPEQLRREAIGPAADVYALAIAAYEGLVGELPFPAEVTHAGLLQRQLNDRLPLAAPRMTGISESIDDVLQLATAKRAEDRYLTVDDFVEAFLAATDTERPTASAGQGRQTLVVGDDARNPYKGLQAFQEADASDFFGRNRLVDRLLAQLTEPGPAGRLLGVVGPSGSGKSSVVRAGLLPAIRRGEIPGSEHWFLTSMVPGSDPFGQLDASLARVAIGSPTEMTNSMQTDKRGIGRAVRRVLPEDGQLVLVIDQFEELFTLLDDEISRKQFLEGVLAAVTSPHSQLRVVVTMRADFWDRPLRYGGFARLLDEAAVTVMPLAPDELERAIVDPAAANGVEFEPGLVSEIVADVADQPGALPMLQHALTQLYARRTSGLMTSTTYAELGGISGAMAATAEEIYTGLDTAHQNAARRLFTRLVTLGEGAEDTRRRIPISELDDAPEISRLIDRFGEFRMLSFDRDVVTREPTVEVAHEALIRDWPRLRSWVEEDRDSLRLHRHLTGAANEWAEQGRPEGDLYRGARLAALAEWSASHARELNDAESAFLRASKKAEAESEAREQLRHRRTRGLLVLTSLFLLAALAAGALALRSSAEAGSQREVAEARADAAVEISHSAGVDRLVASVAPMLDTDRELATLLALEATQLRNDTEPQVLLGAALTGDLAPLTIRSLPNPPSATALSGDGSVAAFQENGQIRIIDASTGRTMSSLEAAGLHRLELSPRGNVLVDINLDTKQVVAYDSRAGEVLGTMETEFNVGAVSFNADGENVLLGLPGTGNAGYSAVMLWNPFKGTSTVIGAKNVPIGSFAALSPAGDFFFAGGGTEIGVYRSDGLGLYTARFNGALSADNSAKLKEVGLDLADSGFGEIAAFETPIDGRYIAVGPGGNLAGFVIGPRRDHPALQAGLAADVEIDWDLEMLVPVLTSPEILRTGRVASTAISPDGNYLAIASTTGELAVVSLEDGDLVHGPLSIASGPLTGLAFTGLTTLRSLGPDGTLSDWDLSRPSPLFEPFASPGVAVSEFEDGVLTGSTTALQVTIDGQPSSLLQTRGEVAQLLVLDSARLAAVAYMPSTCTYPVYACPYDIDVLDLETGEARSTIPASGDGRQFPLAGGQRLFTGTGIGQVRLHDIESGKIELILEDLAVESGLPLADVAVLSGESGDRVAAITTDGTVGVWTIEGTTAALEDLVRIPGAQAVAWTSDGKVAIGLSDGQIQIVSPDQLDAIELSIKGHHGGIQSLASGPDPTVLASGDGDEVIVWDLETQTVVLRLPQMLAPRFSRDGDRLLTSSPPGTEFGASGAWIFRSDEMFEQACATLNRDLTAEEWEQYLPAGEPHRPACTR